MYVGARDVSPGVSNLSVQIIELFILFSLQEKYRPEQEEWESERFNTSNRPQKVKIFFDTP